MSDPSLAIVDLAAINANLGGVRTQVGPDRAIMFAVKANAYGHGAVPVARAVEAAGTADMFGVATVDEGVELRSAGITAPIMKFSPCRADEVASALDADLILTVADADTIDQAAAAAAGRPVVVHLKIDTGMNRIGARPEVAADLAARADAAGLALEGIFTHLPSSDVADDGGATARQLDLFGQVVAQVVDRRGPVRWVHAANSGAILGHDLAGQNLVRPGIMGYGYYPDPRSMPTVPLVPALRWTTQVSFVKRVRAGETVSYGRTWTAPADTWVATVPIGYADGYPRLASNTGTMVLGGRAVPVVGRVCMDQTMLDLGPQTPAQVGDEVVVIGDQGGVSVSADDLAAVSQTINYEVLCRISSRVTRHHRHA